MDDTITPSDHQNEAIKACKDWWFNNPDRQWFYLAGYAGTGKSSISPFIVEALGLEQRWPITQFAAYTGKAASVMRRKGMTQASTIHRLIYECRKDPDTGKAYWTFNNESALREAKLLLVDEVSFVNEKIWNDLARFGVRILVVGDPGQLHPPEGQSYFLNKKPDFFLTEVHRHALENPILLFATAARQGLALPSGIHETEHGSVRVINDLAMEELLETDQVLVGTHKTRHFVNKFCLDYQGFKSVLPLENGIKLLCTRNNYDYGTFNGELFAGLGGKRDHEFQMTLDLLSEDDELCPGVKIYTAPFEDYHREPRAWNQLSGREKRFEEQLAQFDYGYGITVHKSQGSQWDKVILIDDGFAKWKAEDRKRWTYTAITRAVKDLTIVQ